MAVGSTCAGMDRQEASHGCVRCRRKARTSLAPVTRTRSLRHSLSTTFCCNPRLAKHCPLIQHLLMTITASTKWSTGHAALEMATHAVFSTHELLESILMHLTFEDLHADQRVCKTWQQVIIKSITLQRKMFTLSRDPHGPVDVRIDGGVRWYDTPLSFNPLVRAVIDEADPLIQHNKRNNTTLQHHPIFGDKRVLDVDFRNTHLPKGLTEATQKAMYLTQPPITELNEVIVTESTTATRCTTGITLNDFALFKRRCSKHTVVNLWHKDGTVDVEDRQPMCNTNETQARSHTQLLLVVSSAVAGPLLLYCVFGLDRLTYSQMTLSCNAGQLLYARFSVRRVAWYETCLLTIGVLAALTGCLCDVAMTMDNVESASTTIEEMAASLAPPWTRWIVGES